MNEQLKVLLTNRKTAYIIDYEGIKYMKLIPHPDGDPMMTKEGVEIILDFMKIPREVTWEKCSGGYTLLLK